MKYCLLFLFSIIIWGAKAQPLKATDLIALVDCLNDTCFKTRLLAMDATDKATIKNLGEGIFYEPVTDKCTENFLFDHMKLVDYKTTSEARYLQLKKEFADLGFTDYKPYSWSQKSTSKNYPDFYVILYQDTFADHCNVKKLRHMIYVGKEHFIDAKELIMLAGYPTYKSIEGYLMRNGYMPDYFKEWSSSMPATDSYTPELNNKQGAVKFKLDTAALKNAKVVPDLNIYDLLEPIDIGLDSESRVLYDDRALTFSTSNEGRYNELKEGLKTLGFKGTATMKGANGIIMQSADHPGVKIIVVTNSDYQSNYTISVSRGK